MKIDFFKVHGLGNDFIFVDDRDGLINLSPEQAAFLCHRNFGVGGDGVLILGGSLEEPTMTIFNSDGSLAEMCGNGIRCFVRQLVKRFQVLANPLSVMTAAGLRSCLWKEEEGRFLVQVDMGADQTGAQPVVPADDGNDLPMLRGHVVSMGNPHFVIFGDFSEEDMAELGPHLTSHRDFPRGTNVEFTRVVTRDSLELKVHERGAGFTLACGTGACAAVAAGVRTGLLDWDRPISVELPGGRLEIVHQSRDGRLLMTGPAQEVFRGTIELA